MDTKRTLTVEAVRAAARVKSVTVVVVGGTLKDAKKEARRQASVAMAGELRRVTQVVVG